MQVRNDSNEGTTHDIERYCAFQQNSFQEAEAANDPSVGYLARAREARMSLLDSIDKSITLIHLLTNSQWGPDIAQFLSCRQSVPTRDKLTSWGDRTIASNTIEASIKRTSDNIQSDLSAFRSHKDLLDSLRRAKYLFDLRCTADGIVAVVELLPTVQQSSHTISTATLILSDVDRPIVRSSPLLKTLRDRAYELVIDVEGSGFQESIMNSSELAELPVPEELLRYRTAALDYVIISKMQDDLESSPALKGGWVLTHSSRCIDSLSISIVGPEGLEIFIKLTKSNNTPSVQRYRRFLRQLYLDECSTQQRSPKSLVSRLIEYILEIRL